jgi:hypothetical protein
MDVMDYCNTMGIELTAWKAKFYDVIRKAEALPSDVRQKMHGNIGDLHFIVNELEERLNSLKNECPAEWSPQKKEIDNVHGQMQSKYTELMTAIANAFKGIAGGMPM